MAHVGQESLLLPAGFHGCPERFGHLLDLLLVVYLLGRVYKRDDHAPKSSLLFRLRSIADAGIRGIIISLFLSLNRLIGGDPHQIGLACDRRAVFLDRLHRGEHLPAQRDQIDRGEIEGYIAQ